MSDDGASEAPEPKKASPFADVKAPPEKGEIPWAVRVARAQRMALLSLGLGSLRRRMIVFALAFWGAWWLLKPPISFSHGRPRPFALFELLGLEKRDPVDPEPTWLPHYLIPLFGLLVAAVS